MAAPETLATLEEAGRRIVELEQELAETNRGLLALTLELERRVEERTAELRALQEELQRSNSELLQLTIELEDRVVERTAQLEAKNEELRSISGQLWHASKLAAIGELAASIAHELNNPLGTVTLRVEGLLGQTPEDDPAREPLRIMEAELDRMSQLVANLLQFGRRGERQISTVDLREEVGRTLELIQYHLRKRRVSVKRIDPERPAMVLADREQLRQVFLNIILNAADAMNDGGVLEIRIAERPGDSPERAPATGGMPSAYTIEFIDDGVGIPPEALAQVMEPFFTTKPEGQGTGLGLAICRRIVTEHGGSIEVLSQVSQGTTVRVVLPMSHNGNNSSWKDFE